MKTDHPLLIGWRAARANFAAGLAVQLAMLAVVLAYYFYLPAHGLLEQLAELKARTGYRFSFLSTAIAGGIVPELFVIAAFQRFRPRRENLENALFACLFWGTHGMIIDAFYRGQAWLFGSQVDVWTVGVKVLIDQLVYNPVYAAPITMILYEWKAQGYRLAGMARVFTAAFYRDRILPTLVANWGVWCPVVCMVYSLPTLLQIPLNNLAMVFWVTLVRWISLAHQK